jgi:hypothetical protein
MARAARKVLLSGAEPQQVPMRILLDKEKWVYRGSNGSNCTAQHGDNEIHLWQLGRVAIAAKIGVLAFVLGLFIAGG